METQLRRRQAANLPLSLASQRTGAEANIQLRNHAIQIHYGLFVAMQYRFTIGLVTFVPTVLCMCVCGLRGLRNRLAMRQYLAVYP